MRDGRLPAGTRRYFNSLYGDHACVTNGFNTRLDTASGRDFLGQFVTLPE
jgi:hypothetical protein